MAEQTRVERFDLIEQRKKELDEKWSIKGPKIFETHIRKINWSSGG